MSVNIWRIWLLYDIVILASGVGIFLVGNFEGRGHHIYM